MLFRRHDRKHFYVNYESSLSGWHMIWIKKSHLDVELEDIYFGL